MKPADNLSDELQRIADEEKALIISFVAPDRSVRVSPIGAVYVSIDIDDLYAIESVVEKLEEQGKLPKKLHLVIQTPGGLVDVSTKIANYLRTTFSEIHAFVPYSASSGGTVLCLAANKITMGRMANLTPIDPQLGYDGIRVSATSYQRTINRFEERFGKKRPAEIPSPYQQMCEKIDPVILTEFNKIWNDTAGVAIGLLEKSYTPKTDEEHDNITNTALALTFSARPHNHIIDAEEASDIGLNIDSSEKSKTLLKSYKKWVKSMVDEEQISHVIKHVCPSNTKEEVKKPVAQSSETVANNPKLKKGENDGNNKK